MRSNVPYKCLGINPPINIFKTNFLKQAQQLIDKNLLFTSQINSIDFSIIDKMYIPYFIQTKLNINQNDDNIINGLLLDGNLNNIKVYYNSELLNVDKYYLDIASNIMYINIGNNILETRMVQILANIPYKTTSIPIQYFN